jgi:hypothetical protein
MSESQILSAEIHLQILKAMTARFWNHYRFFVAVTWHEA